MVSPKPSGTTLAPGPEPVPGLGRGGPSPADARRAGNPVLRTVRPRVPHGSRARARAAGPGAEGLAGGGLLRSRPQHARRGPPDRENAGGSFPLHRARARVPSGRRSVHRPRGRGDRVRSTRGRARGERSAGRGPLDPGGRGRADAARPRPTRGGPRFDPTPDERRRVKRGGHGTRGNGLSADPTGLLGVPGRLRVPGVSRARRSGDAASAPGPRPPTARAGCGRRSRRPRPVARPVPSAVRSPSGSLGVPGRHNTVRGAAGDRRAKGATNRDGPRRPPSRPARHRPVRLQPLHGGDVGLRRPPPGEPRSGERGRPTLGDRGRARPAPPSQGDREGRRAGRGASG